MSTSPSVNKPPIPKSVLGIVCGVGGVIVFGALGGIAYFTTPKNKENKFADIDSIIAKDSDPTYRPALTNLACTFKNKNFCFKKDDILRIRNLDFSLAASPNMGPNVIEIDARNRNVTVNVHLDDIKKIGVLHQAFDYIDRMNQAKLPLTPVCFAAGYNGSAGLSLLPGDCKPTSGVSPS